MRNTLVSMVAAALVAGWMVWQAVPARACFNGVMYEVDEAVKLVAQAERALHAGKPDQAFRRATEALVMLKEGIEISDKSDSYKSKQKAKLHPRAQRVVAVALLRGGEVACKGTSSKPCWAQFDAANNKIWAVATLTAQHQANPGDVSLRALYAEALAAKPDSKAALAILRPMAQADLMPDAHAWALLAKLEHELGQTAARDAAVARCQAMLKKAHHKRCLVVPVAKGQG